MADLQRPSGPRRIPTVLTRDEVKALLDNLPGEVALISRLLYGTGMRLMEAIRLRVKDVDFDRNVIVVREAKGNKDRVVMLPRREGLGVLCSRPSQANRDQQVPWSQGPVQIRSSAIRP
jgi:integrase